MTDHIDSTDIDHDDDPPNEQIDDRSLTVDQLALALRGQACGSATAEASVDLLIDHHHWLTRTDLLALIDVAPSWSTGDLMAVIDRERVHAVERAASTSELQILRLQAGSPATTPPSRSVIPSRASTRLNTTRVSRPLPVSCPGRDLRKFLYRPPIELLRPNVTRTHTVGFSSSSDPAVIGGGSLARSRSSP